MHQKNEVAEVFNGFEKRMKFINIVRTITEYKYADHIRAIFGVEKDRLTNMILAVMVYIKERTLSEDLDCKLSDVQRFLEDTAPVFANNTFYDAEVIAKYIIVDILQHGGEISTFQTFDSQTMSFDMIPVRLIDEEHGNYTLTDDAFDFLFRIKDIDSTLDYSVTRFKMQEYMKRDNYSEALSQSRELVSRIRNIKTGINNFILRCRENISKVSVDEYESLITRIRSLLEDEYKELIEIQKNAEERAAKLSDAASAGVTFEEAKKHKKALKEKNSSPHFYAVANAMNTLWAIDLDKANVEFCRSRILLAAVKFINSYEQAKSIETLIKKHQTFFAHLLCAIRWQIHENEALSALSDDIHAKENAGTSSDHVWWFCRCRQGSDYQELRF